MKKAGLNPILAGSPPRMRGKEEFACRDGSQVGITPAYAGKSFFCPNRILWDKDHPRVCGEKCISDRFPCSRLGSPPRMRGKANSIQENRRERRITPAYAGKSFRDNLVSRQLQDHPRVCGEKAGLAVSLAGRLGSPPRMRGKGPSISRPAPASGITPAYAGKSHNPRTAER